MRISYGTDRNQFGDLRLPQQGGPHPVVAVIHGGYWRALYDLEYIIPVCDALTTQGIATWCIEYRRLGNPGGGFPGTFLDIAAAMNQLRDLAPQHDLDLNRVVLMGHSAGGHLALWFAGAPRIAPGSALYVANPLRVRAAISLAGVNDLRRAWELKLSAGAVGELIGGSPAQFPERFAAASPIELLPFGVRQMLIHGTLDVDVPFEMSQHYHDVARARGDDVTLLALPGVEHFAIVTPESHAWVQVRAAVLGSMGD